MSALPGRADFRPSTLAVLGLAALATVARLVGLGERVAHFDEGRVGYWTIHFAESGEFHYRAIIHGPLIQHVDRLLFEAVGASDLVLRLPVAVFGGLLPLSALLFRERLRETEVVALAFFLALNPVLLYYSRFLRSTLLVAGLMFVAFGLFVRALDTRRVEYVYAGVAAMALGFGAKENAAVYVLCWLGAGALLLDADLFRPRNHESGAELVGDRVRRLRESYGQGRLPLRRYAGHGVALTALFGAVVLFIYAPRDPGPGVGLWEVFASGRVLALLERTATDVAYGYGYWFAGPGETPVSTVVERLGQFLAVLVLYAGPLFALSVVGFLAERWGRERSRDLVMFAGYWGFVSVLGYPVGTDIWGAWITVNAVVPLAVPAAVGVGLLARLGRESLVDEDRVSVGVAAGLLLLVAAVPVYGAATGVYANEQSNDNELVQYAQPADDLRPTLRRMEALSARNDGVDVLFYGTKLTVANPPDDGIYPTCTKMLKTMPLNWYVAMYDATAECARDEGELERTVGDEDPPVVVAPADRRGVVREHLDDGYEARTYRLRTFGSETVFFVDTER